MKWINILMPFVLVAVLVGCGNEKANKNLELGDVEVTLPPQFFEGMTEENIRANAEAEEIKKVKIHEDGSVTYTLTKERQQEILKEFKDELDLTVTDIAGSEDYPSIKRIEANADYTNFDIYVDRAQFEANMDMIATLTLYIGSSYYHAFLGNAESFKATLNYIDESNDEVIESVVLPEALEEGNPDSSE